MTGPEGSPDDESVRLSPPADPWLTEAATSVQGAAGAGPYLGAVPRTDTMPLAAPMPSDRWSGSGRKRRRATLVLVAAAVTVALVGVGVLAVDRFGLGDDNGARGSEPSPEVIVASTPVDRGRGADLAPPGADPAAQGADPAPPAAATTDRKPDGPVGVATKPGSAGSSKVVYEVTASGSRNTGSVSYTDQDGEIIRRNGIRLPWRTTFAAEGQPKPLVLIAQRQSGGDAGSVTCTITVDGKVVSTTTADGKYAAPQCSGSR